MNRITPRWLYGGLIATLVLNIALYFLTGDFNWGRLAGRATAFVAATRFCLQIAREYQPGSVLRKAWLLFAGDAAISIVGH